jgi:hypothetical protein
MRVGRPLLARTTLVLGVAGAATVAAPLDDGVRAAVPLLLMRR